MATIGVNDLSPGYGLLEGVGSLVSAMEGLSESEMKTVVGGSKSSGGGSTVIVNNLAYGFPSHGGAIFGPVTNIVAGGGD
jgi:hypothetical protein